MKISISFFLVALTTVTVAQHDDDLRHRSLAAVKARADAPLAHGMGSILKMKGLSTSDPLHRRDLRSSSGNGKGKGKKKSKACEPEDVNLADFPQWIAEVGYWVGEYSFYGPDGTPFSSGNWNYRYDAYRGFITGNVRGNAYRQRNVFVYPPQFPETCAAQPDSTAGIVGAGTCGVNGNSRVFFADQSAQVCSDNPETAGDIQGPFAGVFFTTTELVGADNALLYQVFLEIPGQPSILFQSQLTTLTIDGQTGAQRRTRTAQSFANGLPRSVSFFREVQVTEEEFYAQLQGAFDDYAVLESDRCAWTDSFNPPPPIVASGYAPGLAGCMEHLEQSFDL